MGHLLVPMTTGYVLVTEQTAKSMGYSKHATRTLDCILSMFGRDKPPFPLALLDLVFSTSLSQIPLKRYQDNAQCILIAAGSEHHSFMAAAWDAFATASFRY